MGTSASPFSDGSSSIDSRINQDFGSRPSRPRPHSPHRQPVSQSRARPPSNLPETPRIFSKEASVQLASSMSVGQQAALTRELRETFKPVFEDEAFHLAYPKMDDVVERQIIRSRHGKFIGQRELILKSTQQKILDLARALISLWSRINAIQLWAEVHFFISKNRRANVMNTVYPRFKNLLKDPSKFLPTREATKVALPSWSGGSGQKTSQKRSDKPKEPRPGTLRQGEPGVKHSYQTRHVKPCTFAGRSLPTPSLVIHDFLPKFPTSNTDGQSVGAKLRLFSREWRSVTRDPWVLQILDMGFHIDFISRPFQLENPGECSMSPQMEAICENEVADFITKKAIPTVPDTPGFFTRIFAIPKRRGVIDR
ncbi:hypothetical protein GHT06_019060 [Daphnia sinensis]|uniref:Uncharacterized protein n=1 Tax=Daphnia sinensis TaxID=1820382 RepID=A0AAD5L057_9CRUS|nr:hypothetical protein GHT06_019060 [Daphnia sinensis]